MSVGQVVDRLGDKRRAHGGAESRQAKRGDRADFFFSSCASTCQPGLPSKTNHPGAVVEFCEGLHPRAWKAKKHFHENLLAVLAQLEIEAWTHRLSSPKPKLHHLWLENDRSAPSTQGGTGRKLRRHPRHEPQHRHAAGLPPRDEQARPVRRDPPLASELETRAALMPRRGSCARPRSRSETAVEPDEGRTWTRHSIVLGAGGIGSAIRASTISFLEGRRLRDGKPVTTAGHTAAGRGHPLPRELTPPPARWRPASLRARRRATASAAASMSMSSSEPPSRVVGRAMKGTGTV